MAVHIIPDYKQWNKISDFESTAWLQTVAILLYPWVLMVFTVGIQWGNVYLSVR